jgi:gliding motility-associated-like protein
MTRYLSLLLFTIASLGASGTHIVGGEIYYKLVDGSTNNYLVTVNVYIDCENGDPRAISSDEDIYISMWNATTNAYIKDFTLTRSAPQRVENTVYACIKEPSGVCVDAYNYETNMIIDPGNNGVILAWQRCCRNNTISNIVNPEAAGFTAWTVIPPSSTVNSSAYFSTVPPVYVCTNVPLQFKQPAIDPDGDSLVYELNTPFLGATSDNPRPENRTEYDRPPFRNLLWRSVYNELNMMAGTPKLSINANTGELNVTPTTIGQFVVGYTVKEYRDGIYISQTRRDYQFNVIECEFDVVANFDIPNSVSVNGVYTFGCNDTVCFNDKSYSKVKPYTLTWDFGDLTTDSDTSHEFRPCYIYPGNGNYSVNLKVKSEICEDEYTYSVRIRSEKPFELGADTFFCEDVNYTLDMQVPDAVDILWNNGQKTSRIIAKTPGLYIANVSYGKCSYSDSIRIIDDRVDHFPLPYDSLLCDSIDFYLDAGVDGISFLWNTSSTDTSRGIQVTEPGTYSVIVNTDHCVDYDTIRIWQASKPLIDDFIYCGTPLIYNFSAVEEAKYLWSTGSTDSSISLSDEGDFWVRITQRNCVNSDTFNITNTTLGTDLGPDKHYCDVLRHKLDAGSGGSEYVWNTGEITQHLDVSTPGSYIVFKSGTPGCTVSDTIILSFSISPRLNPRNFTKICINKYSPYDELVAPEGFSYLWSTGSTERKLKTNKGGYYSLRITDIYGCSDKDSFYIEVDTISLPNELYLPNAFTPNGDGLNDLFPYKDNITQDGYHLMIFNRWGQKAFDSKDNINKTNWDGLYQAERIHNQAFIYLMIHKGCDGNWKRKTGYIYPLH